jgi:hypothetical protein
MKTAEAGLGDLFKRVLEERKNSAFSANPDRESALAIKQREAGWVNQVSRRVSRSATNGSPALT